MRVALIIPSFYPATVYGGPIFATLHAAQALARLGIEVDVLTTNANGTTKLDLRANTFIEQEPHLRIKYYNETKIGRLSLALLFNIWRDISKCDVIHIQSIFSTPTPISLFYASVLRKPVLLSPRGSLCTWCLKERASFKAKWLKFLITPFIHRVTWHATSPQEAADIRKLYPNATVKLISDGVNVETFSTATTLSHAAFIKKFAPHLAPSNGPIIISMGRLHKVKGFDILIDAFHRVKEHYHDAILVIAGGDDGELSQLQQHVATLNLEKSIAFCGELKAQQKIDFLANADLFALPSHTENFGIVYAEALASGTPIVASTNTPWEGVEQAECGKWVPNSAEDTAKAITALLQSSKPLRDNAKQYAQSFDWKDIAKQFQALFKTL